MTATHKHTQLLDLFLNDSSAILVMKPVSCRRVSVVFKIHLQIPFISLLKVQCPHSKFCPSSTSKTYSLSDIWYAVSQGKRVTQWYYIVSLLTLTAKGPPAELSFLDILKKQLSFLRTFLIYFYACLTLHNVELVKFHIILIFAFDLTLAMQDSSVLLWMVSLLDSCLPVPVSLC
jgi:hypothetical protein